MREKITKEAYLVRRQENPMPTVQEYRTEQNEERTPRQTVMEEGSNITNPVGIDYVKSETLCSTLMGGKLEGHSEAMSIHLQLAKRDYYDSKSTFEEFTETFYNLSRVDQYFKAKGKDISYVDNAVKVDQLLKWANSELGDDGTIIGEGNNSINPLTGKVYEDQFKTQTDRYRKKPAFNTGSLFSKDEVKFLTYQKPLEYSTGLTELHTTLARMEVREGNMSEGTYSQFLNDLDTLVQEGNKNPVFGLSCITDGNGLDTALSHIEKARFYIPFKFNKTEKILNSNFESYFPKINLNFELILNSNFESYFPKINKNFEDNSFKGYLIHYEIKK